MNAVLSHDQTAAALSISRQRVATVERGALEKLRLMATLQNDFPLLPGETFAEWFGQLRACARVLATRSGRARTQPRKKTSHALV